MKNIKCNHPMDERWQYEHYWLCCVCYRLFWGDKKEFPLKYIYSKRLAEV